MEIKELTNKQFKEFTESYEVKSIFQMPEYGFTMNDENYTSVFLGLEDNNKIVAASLILIVDNGKFKYAYAPRGFLIDYTNKKLVQTFTSQIKKYLGKVNIIAIKINPLITKNNTNYDIIFNNLTSLGYRHLGYNNNFEALKPRYEAILDIDLPYYILFKNIKKEFRTKIRGAENLGIKIYKGNKDDLEHLYSHSKKKYPRELEFYKNIYHFYKNKAEIYYAKLDTVKYLKIISDKVQEQMEICDNLNIELINNPNILNKKMRNDLLLNRYKNNLLKANKIINEFPNGIILSSILLIKNNKEIYILMDGYEKQYKRFNSKHLLIWKLIEKYSNLGYKKFNFGGIASPKSSNSKYRGLNEFKLSFNSKVIEYIGDFELITNKPLYLMYKGSNKKNTF